MRASSPVCCTCTAECVLAGGCGHICSLDALTTKMSGHMGDLSNEQELSLKKASVCTSRNCHLQPACQKIVNSLHCTVQGVRN